jgi:hypothetical protein
MREPNVLVAPRVIYKIPERVGVTKPVCSKHSVYGEAFIAFVITKYVILEEPECLPGLVMPVELIIDDAYPRTDARQ